MCCWIFFSLIVATAASKRLVMMGGGMADENTDVWSRFVEWSGGSGVARIGVVSAASSTPESSASFYVNHLITYGAADARWIPVHEGNTGANSDPGVVDLINSMTGFFFSGGDQARIVNSFYNSGEESPALAAIRARYEAGAVIGGSSAGTAVMTSAPMIMGGMSWYGLRYGAYPAPAPGRDDVEFNPDGGIRVLDGFITDTHFSERGREGRLIVLISDTRGRSNAATRGIGVDENTALFVDNVGGSNAQGQVVGENGVFIPDLTSAVSGSTGGYWSISNVRANYLTDGDVIDLNTMDVNFASWKRSLSPERYEDGITTERIFNGNRDSSASAPEFVRVARSIFDASRSTTTWGRTEQSGPVFRVTFTQEASSVGRGGYNPVHGRWQIAYSDLRIDIARD